MSRYDELQKLQSLKDTGAISEEEYAREKQRVLDAPELAPARFPLDPAGYAADRPWGLEVNMYCMLLHLSQFAGWVVPGLGFVVPIVMWVLYKDRIPEVDTHGRVVLNWLVSAAIYAAIGFVLTFIFIGFLVLVALAICSIVFTILGAVKANERTVWRYPLSFRFFG
jgi:uncharacterized protein